MSSIKSPEGTPSYIGLVDCNNFFVSCERLFQPHLEGKPVVVLSGHGGIVVARSEQAKSLGIPMGAREFEWREFFRKYDVVRASSHFSLYIDISRRVMQTIRSELADVDVYSVDEAFFMLPQGIDHEAFLDRLREKILHWTGITVSIGLSHSKTLAKVANHIAKKKKRGVYCLLDKIPEVLQTIAVEDIWGIGRKISERLSKEGIHTAADLIAKDDAYIKKRLTVVGLRLVYELRGTQCLELDEVREEKKSIGTARIFPHALEALSDIETTLSTYIERVSEELREQGSVASFMQVFLEKSGDFESFHGSYSFAKPTNFTPSLISTGKAVLRSLFREGLRYRRVGVLLGGLLPENAVVGDLFSGGSQVSEKEAKVCALMDELNQKIPYGRRRKAVTFASSLQKETAPERPSRWDSLPVVRT